jgi:hypothetical protein
MADTATQIKKIQEKLQLLVKQHLALQKENSQLTTELDHSKQLLAANIASMDDLKQKLDIAKMGTGAMNEAERKEMEKRINGYVKEIDRCIALLGS